jgi:hypothetical protein
MKRTHGRTHYEPAICFGCKCLTLQLQPGSVFRPHYNYSVGKYVNNDREFRDALKYRGEQNSLATGLDTDYQPKYPGESEPIRSADGVLDETAKRIRDAHV